MTRRSLSLGIGVVVVWAATVALAFRAGLHSIAPRPPASVAERALASAGGGAVARSQPEPNESAPEVFSPAHRPSWEFSSRMDAGRRAVLNCLLEDANNYDLEYAKHIFGGLDATGREEALARLATIEAVDLRSAAFQVLFSEWAAEDPEAAIRRADALKDTPGGSAAVAYAWARFLEEDPAALGAALDAWPQPGSWDEVMTTMGEASDETGDFRSYAEVLRTLVERDACDRSALSMMAGRLHGKPWGTPEETLRLFAVLQDRKGAIVDVEQTRYRFDSFLRAHWEDPRSVAQIAAQLPAVGDATTRAGMIMGMGEAWLKIDPGAALASTDSLPDGLREKVHSELFEQLVELDERAAADYFKQMPAGDLRDHLLAFSMDGWIEKWGRESLLDQIPGVRSDIVVVRMLDATVESMVQRAWDDSLALSPADQTIERLLASQDRMPSAIRRRNFVESIYEVWARSGTAEPPLIAARLDQETTFTPGERRELMEALTGEYERAAKMRAPHPRFDAEPTSEGTQPSG